MESVIFAELIRFQCQWGQLNKRTSCGATVDQEEAVSKPSSIYGDVHVQQWHGIVCVARSIVVVRIVRPLRMRKARKSAIGPYAAAFCGIRKNRGCRPDPPPSGMRDNGLLVRAGKSVRKHRYVKALVGHAARFAQVFATLRTVEKARVQCRTVWLCDNLFTFAANALIRTVRTGLCALHRSFTLGARGRWRVEAPYATSLGKVVVEKERPSPVRDLPARHRQAHLALSARSRWGVIVSMGETRHELVLHCTISACHNFGAFAIARP